MVVKFKPHLSSLFLQICKYKTFSFFPAITRSQSWDQSVNIFIKSSTRKVKSRNEAEHQVVCQEVKLSCNDEIFGILEGRNLDDMSVQDLYNDVIRPGYTHCLALKLKNELHRKFPLLFMRIPYLIKTFLEFLELRFFSRKPGSRSPSFPN